jgi:four helix bundle protein
MAKSYRELLVWQKGIPLSVLVYQLSKAFPREDLYGLTSQMRRAAVSIPSNIAEGAGRLNTPEYRQFLGIARGSSFELQTHLTIQESPDLAMPPRSLWRRGCAMRLGK